MGDPFSVAGTAVGIASLGIQVCQILARYYSQYRGIHDEINNIVDRTNALEICLKSLARVKLKIETDDVALSTELQQALRACKNVLARLKDMAERYGETKAPDNLSDRIRMARKRLLWPFKRDTLVELQNTLDRFQSNLGLALQLLGLDFEADQLKMLVTQTDQIHKKIHKFSTAQAAHTTQLNASISNLSDQLALTHIADLSSLDEISTAQKSHTALVQTGFQDLSKQHEQLLKQSAAIQHILEQLVPTVGTSYSLSALSLPSIAAHHRGAKTVRKYFNHSLQRYEANIPRNQSCNMSEPANCFCRRTRNDENTTKVGKWITLYSESTYEHAPDCPYFSHSEFSKTVGLRFNMCNFLIRRCVQVGYQQSRIQGWCTISPFIRYRAIVPDDSEIFKALDRAFGLAASLCSRVMLSRASGGKVISLQTEAEEILPNLLDNMRQCFANNAHPTDTDRYGGSILQKIMWILDLLVVEYGLNNETIIFNFLDACHTTGIFSGNLGSYAMIRWHFYAVRCMIEAKPTTAITSKILYYVSRRLKTWKLGNYTNDFPGVAPEVYGSVTKLLSIEEISTGFSAKDRFHEAIIRQSESDFQSCIETSDQEYLASSLTWYIYTRPLAVWDVGLKILISSGTMDSFHVVQDQLWDATIKNLSIDSLQVLIRSKWRGLPKYWYELNRYVHAADKKKFATLPRLGDVERYRPIVRSLAAKLQKQWELEQDTNSIGKSVLSSKSEFPFYHTPFLHVKAAEDLWNAGYRNIDILELGPYVGKVAESPLWINTLWIGTKSGLTLDFSTALWFVKKGANAFRSHPILLTTPAHILVRKAILHAIVHGVLHVLQSTRDLFMPGETDRCSCNCSLSGCYIISCAFSEHVQTLGHIPSRHPEGAKVRSQRKTFRSRKCLPWLLSILDQQEVSKDMATAVIRLLTFEELSLTHTCCLRVPEGRYGSRNVTDFTWKKHEIEKIHDIEKKDMALLDDLMEELEDQWNIHIGSFTSFIKQVWGPRMKTLHVEQKDLHHIYQETGAKLSVIELDELHFLEILDENEDEEEV